MLQLSSELMNDELLNSLLQHGMHDPPTILLLEDVDLLHAATLKRDGPGVDHAAEQHEELLSSVARSLRDDQDRDTGRRKRGGKLSLSGLLNALDGPTATTGRLLFMTTNAKHRLDPALLRSGRVDYEIEFRAAGQEQIQRLFSRFYSDFTPASGAQAKDTTPNNAAGLQRRLVEPRAPLDPVRRDELAASFAARVAASGVELTTADVQRHLMKHKKDPDGALEELSLLLGKVGKVEKRDAD